MLYVNWSVPSTINGFIISAQTGFTHIFSLKPIIDIIPAAIPTMFLLIFDSVKIDQYIALLPPINIMEIDNIITPIIPSVNLLSNGRKTTTNNNKQLSTNPMLQ